MRKTFTAVAAVFFAALALLSGCKNSIGAFEQTDYIMDTVAVQKIYAPQNKAANAASAVLSELNRLDGKFSAYNEESEIYGLNSGRTDSVSEETAALVKRALLFAEESQGVFDVTVYPLSVIWKKAREEEKLPGVSEIKEALAKVGSDKISMSETQVTLSEGSGIDLGAVAKGAAVDYADSVYDREGITSAVLSIGESAMLVKGKKGNGKFSIGLRDPFSQSQSDIFAVLSVSDTKISSSGGYERYFEIDGKRYHHIIDTGTGFPKESDVAGATVCGDDGVYCDYMSTRLFLEGFDSAVRLAQEKKIPAVIVSSQKKVYVSPALEKSVKITDDGFERIVQ